MQKFLEKIRIFILVALIFTATALTFIRLMKIQLVEGEELLALSISRTSGSQTIEAPRGEIVDINGDVVVQNRVGYNVVIDYSFFPKDKQQQNEIILRVANILLENYEGDDLPWIESIPVSVTHPYVFDGKEADIVKLRDNIRVNEYANATNCIDKLIEDYEISDVYTIREKRIIAGIRYEMLIKEFSVSNQYLFATDIPFESVAKIYELSYGLSGVDVIEAPFRTYNYGEVLSHLIGTVGPITAEKYAELKLLGYGINDVVGREGIESFAENRLRGIDGARTVTVSADRKEIDIKTTEQAIPGKTVMLTVDMEYQAKVQDRLKEHIAWMNDLPEDIQSVDITTGSVVVLDCNTGAVKAMASYPYYDINDYINDYASVLSAENNPLFNRALNGAYRPGSTFKTITATAALNEGVITPSTKVRCQQEYHYLDVKMHCTNWHGSIDIKDALQYSCNIFFYDIADDLGIKTLVDYENMFGLGVDLGFELGGEVGYLACPETFDRFPNLDWTPGQTLQASIGQSEVAVTPLAMAVQASVLANGGTRYRPYIIDSVWDYNMTTCLEKTKPEVMSQLNENYDYVFDTVKEGMVLAGQYGTSYAMIELPQMVAAKTGTPQTSLTSTNVCMVAYYPAEDPEIAISVVIEKGEKSSRLGPLVKNIIDDYYGYTYEADTPEEEPTDESATLDNALE